MSILHWFTKNVTPNNAKKIEDNSKRQFLNK